MLYKAHFTVGNGPLGSLAQLAEALDLGSRGSGCESPGSHTKHST